MAIDDNTSYELTGYQVKDLAGRIRRKADASAIPTVNDATLTIQHNGSNVQTFTANQSTNATADIETIYSVDVSSTQPITQVVSTAMIQDEAVTTAKIDDGAVTSAKTAFGGNYSTSEVNTGFTWIDGKPIYKKTYSMGALINGGGTLVQNISSLDFETVVELRGIAVNPSNHNARPLPLVSNGLSDMVRLDVSSNEIHVITTSGSSWSTTYNAYVTIWYTKTTD